MAGHRLDSHRKVYLRKFFHIQKLKILGHCFGLEYLIAEFLIKINIPFTLISRE